MILRKIGESIPDSAKLPLENHYLARTQTQLMYSDSDKAFGSTINFLGYQPIFPGGR